MDIRTIKDDFFRVGNIAVLQKMTGNNRYDFRFRDYFNCESVISEVEAPVLLHIGAIDNYDEVEASLDELGMKLLIHEAEHLRCSTIEKWYPVIKEKTPFTVVYDELPPLEELLQDFTFPVFIKGNRQTNRHNKSQCIIEDAESYLRLCENWFSDPILHWQKAAVREYIPLMTIDDSSYPEQVPISYEFRFFYFEGKCMGYGPYWTMGKPYAMQPEDLASALALADWAAERLSVIFPAIDLAKTASGEWIIIEVNDAQESGFAGIDPISLWNNTISALQNRTWISVDDLPEGIVILAGDPAPEMSVEEMQRIAAGRLTTQELVDAYVMVHNKFWWIEDEAYDYEEGTQEHEEICAVIDAWGELYDDLQKKVVSCAEEEGLFAEKRENTGSIKQLEAFMDKYGYYDGRGWWVKRGKEGSK